MTPGCFLRTPSRRLPLLIARPRKLLQSCRCSYPHTPVSTLYDLLGLDAAATKPQVKQAYRVLVQKYHPDVNGDEMRQVFKAMNLAYEVLLDSELRRTYDDCGLAALGPRFAYLRTFLTASGGQQSKGGVDVFIVAGLSLREAVLGVEKALLLDAVTNCSSCQGSGMATAINCTVCGGSGEILRYRPHPVLGKAVLLGGCPGCKGTGCVQLARCQACSGKGQARSPTEVRVRIPAGVESGSVVKVVGQGEPGRFGGVAGDLYVQVLVHSDERVARKGRDLHTEVEVDVFDAMLGTTLTVRTMKGPREIHVPPGTQHGDELALHGAGVPSASRGIIEYGDHVFRVAVIVPNLSCLSASSAASVKQKLQHLAMLHKLGACADAC